MFLLALAVALAGTPATAVPQAKRATKASPTAASEPLPSPGAPRRAKKRARVRAPAGLRAKTAPRPRQAKKPQKAPAFWETWDRHDYLRWGVPSAFFFVLLLTLRRWRRIEDADFDAATKGAMGQTGAAARFHARPVFLPKGGQNFDPAAKVDDVIQRFGQKRPPTTMTPTLSLDDEDEDEAVKAELEDVLAASAAVRAEEAAQVELRRAGANGDRLVLPGAMSQHFDGLPGEKIEWQAKISVALLAEGHVIVTNDRVLAVFQQKSWTFLPPRVETVHRRVSLAVSQISRAETGHRRRGLLLFVALVTVFFYPLGTTIALVCLGLHVVARRPVLEIKAGYATFTLPLALADVKDATRILNKSRSAAPPPVKAAA